MKTVLLFVSIVIAGSIYGQPDFSGSWKLNAEKSQFNNIDPLSAPVKLVVEQKNGTITYQRNERAKETLKIDSTVSIEVAGAAGNKTKVSMKLTSDKMGLIETRTYVYAEGQSGIEAKKIRTWTLADEKKLLIILDQIELTSGQVLEMQLVYERQ